MVPLPAHRLLECLWMSRFSPCDHVDVVWILVLHYRHRNCGTDRFGRLAVVFVEVLAAAVAVAGFVRMGRGIVEMLDLFVASFARFAFDSLMERRQLEWNRLLRTVAERVVDRPAVDCLDCHFVVGFLDCCRYVGGCLNSNDFLTSMSLVENLKNCQNSNSKKFAMTVSAAVVAADPNFVLNHHCMDIQDFGMDMVAHRMANSKWLHSDRFLFVRMIAVDIRRWLFPVSQALMGRYFGRLVDFRIVAVALGKLVGR